jgi:MFS family permease
LRSFISEHLGIRRPLFYGWWIVAAALVGSAVSSGTTFWTFTVYIQPLEDDFGWSRAQVAAAFSLGLLVSGIVGPLAGRSIDRFGARLPMLIASVLTAGSFVLLAQTQTLWQFYAIYMLHALVRTWMFFIPIQWILSRWFVRRRGTALGFATAGFGVGGAVFVPLINFFIETWGWRVSYEISGAIIVATFVPMALFILRDNPQDVGTVPDGVDEPTAAEASRPAFAPTRDWELGEAVRSRAFWLLAAAFALFFMAQISILVHIVPFLENAGISAGVAASLVSYSAIIRTVVRVGIGVAVDRIADLRTLAIIVVLGQATGVLLLTMSTHPAALVIFVVIWGLGGGAGPVLEPLLLTRTFGLANFGAILGVMELVGTAGIIAGPVMGGAIFDSTGSYIGAFLLYVGIYLGSCVAFFFGARSMRRQTAVSASPGHR